MTDDDIIAITERLDKISDELMTLKAQIEVLTNVYVNHVEEFHANES